MNLLQFSQQTGTKPARRWPVVILWPATAAIATIGECWRRLPSGEIEATYHTVEQLRIAIETTQMIRAVESEARQQIKQAELFTVRQQHNYQE